MAATMDTSESLTGERNRAMADAMSTSEDLLVTQEKRCRASDFHSAFVTDKEIVREHAYSWDREMEAR